MKLILERWRQYVNEELLNEVPLEDFGYVDRDYPKYDNDSNDPRRGSSVGYKLSTDPAYKDQAIKFFDQTKDLWYIVFLKTTFDSPYNFKKIEEGDEEGLYEIVKQMQKDNNWNPNGKYIVVSFPPFGDIDESSPAWQIVHDIIGHTIETKNSSRIRTIQELPDDEDEDKYPDSLNAIWSSLPAEMQISEMDEGDRIPDILGAIFLGKAPAIEDIQEDAQWLFKEFIDIVDSFKSQIKEGEFWYFGGWN
jgi:hypothetical protein